MSVRKFVRKWMCAIFGHSIMLVSKEGPLFYDTICRKCGEMHTYKASVN